MVDRLVDAGFVVRRRDPADRRAWQLCLTERVERLVSDVQPLVDELYVDAMSGFNSGERDNLRRLLAHLRTNISGSRP